MSHTTTKWGLIVPDETDADDVPSWLDQLASKIDATITGWKADTWANRPIGAGLIDGLLFWATDQGAFYLVQGGVLHAITVVFGSSGVTTAAFGDNAAVGNSANGAAPIDHRHGMPTNPVTPHVAAVDPHADRTYATNQDAAHVAAGDPHPQYALDTDVSGVLFNSLPRYTRPFMLMGA